MDEQQKTPEERMAALLEDPEVAQAVAAAKASLAPQYAQFGIEPEVYVIEACGLPCVLLPWSNQKRLMAVRAAETLPPIQKAVKLAEAVVTDCLWWIRGQQGEGRPGALRHATGLANLVGGKYMNLLMQLGGEMMSMLGDQEESPAAGKKL